MARESRVKAKTAPNQPQKTTPTGATGATRSNQPAPQAHTSQVSAPLKPVYPTWPTSTPGPRHKLAPEGSHAINAFRPEQLAEIAYNQETGKSK